MVLIPDLVGVVADRPARGGTHERVHDRPARRDVGDLGVGCHRRARVPATPRSRSCPTRATGSGRFATTSPQATGLPAATPVIHVGSHDTASAVVGVPAAGDTFAYISCGTWGLVGVELDGPVVDGRQPRGELHERARRGRQGALPAQRDGAVAPPGIHADVGARPANRRTSTPAGRRGEPSGGGSDRRPERSGVPAARRHAGADRERHCSGTDSQPHRPERRLVRCILDSLAAAFASGRARCGAPVGPSRRHRPPGRRRSAERSALPAHG